MFSLTAVTFLHTFGVFISVDGYPSNQPVIGMLMETIWPGACNGQYRVLSSYQSFIEQGGGGVVPIFVNQTDDYYERLIPRLNGVLLPGGGVDLVSSFYGKAAYTIFKMATKFNDDGSHFPIWGTCLGMQEMTTWPFNPRQVVLSNCTGTENVALKLNFTANADQSKLFGGLPYFLKQILAKESVTPNFHNYCVSTRAFLADKPLNDYYSMLSTNLDTTGKSFVSTLEARHYPFYGVQWHPEKINFQHTPGLNIDQSNHAILVSQHFGNFLVEQAKLNKHTFKSLEEESRFLINGYPSQFVNFLQYYCLSDSDVPKFDD